MFVSFSFSGPGQVAAAVVVAAVVAAVAAVVADTGLNFIAELESSSLTVLHYCNDITIIKAAIMELKL